MVVLKDHLKQELAEAIVDFWVDTPKKYCQLIDLIIQHGTWNATAVLMEEVWLTSEGLVDKTFLHVIEALFPYLHKEIETRFAEFTRTGEVSHVSNA